MIEFLCEIFVLEDPILDFGMYSTAARSPLSTGIGKILNSASGEFITGYSCEARATRPSYHWAMPWLESFVQF
jgi:hypothetical protein